MQRVRMSLPYFTHFGWDTEVVTVDDRFLDIQQDPLLVKSVPGSIKVHKVEALPKKWTAKLGLGSIALRSLWFYKKKVNKILETQSFDLVYFSTTQFPVCILGAYWKKKFGIKYIIDMQDPWHSDYYLDKPKSQRPPKHWLSYRLNKYMEPLAMNHADGLISVSERYITDLKTRYIKLKGVPASLITFGYFEPDMDIAQQYRNQFENLLQPGSKNLVYVGRGGADMHAAITPLFVALKQYLLNNPYHTEQLKLYFIGTSYAATGKGVSTIQPLAEQLGVQANVVEITDRISYYHALVTLQQADALFIPGSDDPKYTASKIYPYLLAEKPLLAVFNPESPALRTLNLCGVETAYSYCTSDLATKLSAFFHALVNNKLHTPAYNKIELEKHSALNMTRRQCQLFDTVLQQHEQ